jgi:hypothetical protein
MRRLVLLLVLTFICFRSFGQGLGQMEPNRFSYVSLGLGFPYVSGRIAYEATHNTYIEVQGLTDGGGIWRSNVYNDWRSISLIKAFDLKPLASEIRIGAGMVQTEEKITQQRSNTFGMTPSLGFSTVIHSKWAIYGSLYYPISPATSLTTGITLGLEYRIGRYVKENGLYSRKGRPKF